MSVDIEWTQTEYETRGDSPGSFIATIGHGTGDLILSDDLVPVTLTFDWPDHNARAVCERILALINDAKVERKRS